MQLLPYQTLSSGGARRSLGQWEEFSDRYTQPRRTPLRAIAIRRRIRRSGDSADAPASAAIGRIWDLTTQAKHSARRLITRLGIPLLVVTMLLGALVVLGANHALGAPLSGPAAYAPLGDKGGNGGGQADAGGKKDGKGGDQGKGNGQGQGKGNGQGQGNGNGQGQGNGNGNGQGKGNGNGNGQGNGSPPGQSHGSVSKRADRATAAPGDLILYTITLRNGSTAATVALSDKMPPHTSFVSASGPCTVTGGNDQKLDCRVALPANGTAIVQVSLRVDASAPCNSMLTNVAHVNGWGSAQAQTRVVCVAATATAGSAPTATNTALAATATRTAAAVTATSTVVAATPTSTAPPATATATPAPETTGTPTATATAETEATVTGTPEDGATATATATGTLAPPPTVTPGTATATATTTPTLEGRPPTLIAGSQDGTVWGVVGTVLILLGVGLAFAARSLRGTP
jgi:uncharacterized repeat protein (TIGR01451 family)